jgi:glycosyltransferase involved in cell wall biosynthesis
MTGAEREALLGEGIAAERVSVVGVGCHADAMGSGDGLRFRRRHRIRGPVVLHPGTLTHDKGTPHLVEAMKLLWRWGQDATLVLTGAFSPDFRDYLDSQPDWVRMRCRFVHYGSDEKADVFAAADVMALPSRAESYGAVYLEAWSAGTPVIGSWAGGVPEVIREGEDGFLVPFADYHRLAEYVCALLQDPALATRMGERGREKVRAGCTWMHRCAEVERLWGRLLTMS